ncbi:MAG: ABC transporter ATP-binding protein [Acidimicrobiia bacterium]|nr:ABC transporter ATP-binding protein [Acidimicrobiia bacterium]
MLETRGLEVVYQDVIQALRGVSIQVPHGAIVAMLGPNGAGKTTTLRAVTGLLDFHKGRIAKGSVHFDGEDVSTASAARLVSGGIAQVLEGRRIFPTLTVDENLKVGTGGRRRPDALEKVWDLFPVLAERRQQPGGYLSGGEQQMLAMARALVSDPRLLVLDEPSLGLAPKLVDVVADLITRINELGTTVLLVEQNAAVALDISHHGYVVENGRIVMDAPSAELRRNEDILEFYLGVKEGGERRSYADVKHYRRRKRWLS